MSRTPILSVRDIRTWFPIRRGVFSRTVGHVKAVDGVSFDIYPGKVLGLVGESGCGKSTLARTILRLEKAQSGSVLFEGRDLLHLPQKELREVRKQVQVVFQDPFSSLNPRMSILDTLTEGAIQHKVIRPSQRAELAAQLLSEVDLGDDMLHRYPHECSGGQRQRVGVARALSLQPKLLICDEAVSALDVSVQAQVINLLMSLQASRGLAYLFISHDLSVVHHVADEIAVMYLGRIVELGTAQEIITKPVHPYTRALISAIPRVGQDGKPRITLQGDVPSPADPPPGCPFHPRCRHAQEQCSRQIPALNAYPAEEPTARRVACLRADEIQHELGG